MTRTMRSSAIVRSGVLALLMALAAFLAAAPAAQAARFFDPERGQWVEYDDNRAQGAARAPSEDPMFLPQMVAFRTAELPGTIIIDSDAKFLYLVLPDFQAIRYGVGVGREGFGWSGIVQVGRKAEWPTWTPPPEMIARDPNAARFANGMPGGPDNPLGHVRSISTRATATPSTASTGRPSHGLSARTSRPAASVCATRISPTFTSACRSARRSSSSCRGLHWWHRDSGQSPGAVGLPSVKP